MHETDAFLTWLGTNLTASYCLAVLFWAAGVQHTPKRRRSTQHVLPAQPRGQAQTFRRWSLRLLSLLSGVLLAGYGLPTAPLFPLVAAGAVALRALKAVEGRQRAAVLALQLMQTVREAVSSGAGFFPALANGLQNLPEGRLKGDLQTGLQRYTGQRNPGGCLDILQRHGGALAVLASSVRVAGWEASPALQQVCSAAHQSALEAWKGGAGRRLALDRLRGCSPVLGWLTGAAAAAALRDGLPPSLPLLLAAGLLAAWLLKRGALHGRALHAAALLWSAALLLQPVPAGAGVPQAPPVRTTRAEIQVRTRDVRPPEPVEQPAPQIPITETLLPGTVRPAVPVFCRVETGVADGWANLRSGAGMGHAVQAVVAQGARLQVLGEGVETVAEGRWQRVRTGDGVEGWIYAPLCLKE